MDFLNGITFQRFEVEGWDLVKCLLISFCLGSEILKTIGPPHPPKTPGFAESLWIKGSDKNASEK